MQAVKSARLVHVRGVVQGVGFRPFVYRLAMQRNITGWVRNGESGVTIHAEGDEGALEEFLQALEQHPPPAASITHLEVARTRTAAYGTFEIRESRRTDAPTVRVSPDLPICEECLYELFDPRDRRYRYPYINCTNCGPRYSIVRGLPYDRAQTTMAPWPMCERCLAEYSDPLNRRFHAQPVACPQCGPTYVLEKARAVVTAGYEAIAGAAQLLREGAIVGVKGLGGFHLACDARNPHAVAALRQRKYRKERPFALMVRNAAAAMELAHFDAAALHLLQSQARPIVLAPAKVHLEGIAPDNADAGVMVAYAPVHHLLFDAGGPGVLVMTSANRSSEPIAYIDDDARARLYGIADALLIGEREIARRIDDSVATATSAGAVTLRHARGYAPRSVASLPAGRSILAVGGDLKNAIALIVGGQVFLSQHIGDLEQYDAFESFKSAIRDLRELYEIGEQDIVVAHDAHPEYVSSTYARDLPGEKIAVQHHRAHIASVLAERGAFTQEITGFAFDGTGYGDDGAIWGGEVFRGSLERGLHRVAHLRPAPLAGGDAAARYPVQAAAGFVADLDVPDLHEPPFGFSQRYDAARELLRSNLRTFQTTSMGRLFDAAAALLGYVRPVTFEAQAAMWFEHLARAGSPVAAYPFPFSNGELDYRPALLALLADRRAGRDVRDIARAFHAGVVQGVLAVANAFDSERIVVSGGVFQNAVLLNGLHHALGNRLWANRAVPPNDGGIPLGQAALAAMK